jgi:hypothetical protein
VATTPGTSPLLTASLRSLSAAAFMAFLLVVGSFVRRSAPGHR